MHARRGLRRFGKLFAARTPRFGPFENRLSLVTFANIQTCNSKSWAISSFGNFIKLKKHWPWQFPKMAKKKEQISIFVDLLPLKLLCGPTCGMTAGIPHQAAKAPKTGFMSSKFAPHFTMHWTCCIRTRKTTERCDHDIFLHTQVLSLSFLIHATFNGVYEKDSQP